MSRLDPVTEGLRRALTFLRRHPGRVRALATVLAGLLLLVAILGPYALPSASRHLSAFEDGRQDLSRFRDTVTQVTRAANGGDPQSVATSPYLLAGVEDARSRVLFVFGVERPYTDGETQAVLDFVARGGTIVLANDVGNANGLSQEFGVVFFDKTILDRSNFNGEPKLVTLDVPFGDRAYHVVMNAPSYATITDPARATVVASSSADSFIDVNDDGQIDIHDTPGPFPLVTTGSYGAGKVIVLADSGLFTNEMQAISGFENAAFARALATSAASGHGSALIDESRHAAPPSARSADAAMRLFVLATNTAIVRYVLALGAVALVAIAVWATRDEEDWSVHTFDVGHEIPAPEALRPTSERLSALAARAVCEKYNIPFEYLEAAPLEEIVRLTGDRELAAVAKGVERPADARAFYAKLADEVPISVSPVIVPKEEVSS